MRLPFALLAFSVVAAFPAALHADDGFRCATGRLVSVGDRMGEVRDRCGSPDATAQRVEKHRVKHRLPRRVGDIVESYIEEVEIEVPLEEWTYDLGRGSFTRYVTFANGVVINVVTGDYGTK